MPRHEIAPSSTTTCSRTNTKPRSPTPSSDLSMSDPCRVGAVSVGGRQGYDDDHSSASDSSRDRDDEEQAIVTDRDEEDNTPLTVVTAQLVDDAAEEQRIIARFANQLPRAIEVELYPDKDATASEQSSSQNLCSSFWKKTWSIIIVICILIAVTAVVTMQVVGGRGNSLDGILNATTPVPNTTLPTKVNETLSPTDRPTAEPSTVVEANQTLSPTNRPTNEPQSGCPAHGFLSVHLRYFEGCESFGLGGPEGNLVVENQAYIAWNVEFPKTGSFAIGTGIYGDLTGHQLEICIRDGYCTAVEFEVGTHKVYVGSLYHHLEQGVHTIELRTTSLGLYFHPVYLELCTVEDVGLDPFPGWVPWTPFTLAPESSPPSPTPAPVFGRKLEQCRDPSTAKQFKPRQYQRCDMNAEAYFFDGTYGLHFSGLMPCEMNGFLLTINEPIENQCFSASIAMNAYYAWYIYVERSGLHKFTIGARSSVAGNTAHLCIRNTLCTGEVTIPVSDYIQYHDVYLQLEEGYQVFEFHAQLPGMEVILVLLQMPDVPTATSPTDRPTAEPSTAVEANQPLSPTNTPTNEPTPSEYPNRFPKDQVLFDLIASHTVDNGISMQTHGSPQNEAYLWLESDSYSQQLSENRKIQRYALATFFYSTQGEQWPKKSAWLEAMDECVWHTDTTSLFSCEGEVFTVLELKDNNVVGTLPPELGLLSGLKRLAILNTDGAANGGLTGGFPQELGQVTTMLDLEMSGNTFSDPFPIELFENWTKLDKLLVENNQIPGPLPTSVGALVTIQRFNVARNRLTGPLPTELGQMTDTRNFFAAGNQFTGTIPSEMGLMVQIRAGLDLSDNQLSGVIPDTLNAFSLLRSLALHNNILIGPVPDLSALTSLTLFRVDGNSLTGAIPPGTCAAARAAANSQVYADCSEVTCECCTHCCIDGNCVPSGA